jgi:hypothetical protein
MAVIIEGKDLPKINKQVREISKSLIEKHKTIPRAIERAMVIEGNNLRNYIITSMRNTNRLLTSVTKGYNKKKKIVHHPSAPGFPPAIDTGELIRSILYDVKELELRVGTFGGAPYGVALEDPKNTRKSGRRKWLKPAVDANKDRIIKNIKAAVKKTFKEVGRI